MMGPPVPVPPAARWRSAGTDLPRLVTPVPGPRSRALAQRLRRVECPQITWISDQGPIFWRRARGANVEDVDGNRYIDLTAGFGVAAVGHANPRVAAAAAAQVRLLAHGLGDVHPTELKVRLAERLSQLAPGDLGRVIFSSTGSEAVESAIKTVRIATGKPGIVAFEGSYHGLGLGALAATGQRRFRDPFLAQLPANVVHVPFPRDAESGLQAVARAVDRAPPDRPIGGVLIEPVLGRGGVRPVPREFLVALRRLCDQRGLLLVADEVFTGFGRTGRWFAVEHAGVVPDLLCLGKAMTGGFPLSACLGRPAVMDAWGPSTGEALHTSTFLGNPLGCAMALAAIDEIAQRGLVERAAVLGAQWLQRLRDWARTEPRVREVRGLGLLIGIELQPGPPGAGPPAAALAGHLLRDGVIALPSGEDGCVLSLSPPLVIHQRQIDYFLESLPRAMRRWEQEG